MDTICCHVHTLPLVFGSGFRASHPWQGTQSVSAGFHWDHLQNIHVVLSGSKEASGHASRGRPGLPTKKEGVK